jgi:hypothetical protein
VTITVGPRGIFRARLAVLIIAIVSQFVAVGQHPESLIPSAGVVLLALLVMWHNVRRYLAWQELQQHPTDQPPGDQQP